MVEYPYKGLASYDEADSRFFCGRESDRKIVAANLMSHRLTVLYGPSGVGKSSLLIAGVAAQLREGAADNRKENGIPESVVVSFRSWRRADPLAALISTVRGSVAAIVGGKASEPMRSRSGFVEALEESTEMLDGELFIILDQFEEYFLYHLEEDGEATFATEFPRAVKRPNLRVSFLVCIREDSLARLDRFKPALPELFDNSIRLKPLDVASARVAIEEPVEEYNRLLAFGEDRVQLESALVEEVLRATSMSRVITPGQSAKARVEASYLQVVMSRLWAEERRVGSHVIRLETLRRLGEAEGMLRNYLESVVNELTIGEQEVAAKVFRFMITPSGGRISLTPSDLAAYAGLHESDVKSVLEKVVRLRIVDAVVPSMGRPEVVEYQIMHDLVASAVVDWQQRYWFRAGQHGQQVEEATVRRLRWWVAGLTALSVVSLIAAVIAWIK